MTASENNSNQQSPTFKENSEDGASDGQNGNESTSMIEEIASPSTKSFCEETEKHPLQKMLEGSLIPQRSLSTPLIFSHLNLRPFRTGANDSHKQVQHALETLQKKMMMEQQASLLKDILLKVHLSQGPLSIPPLASSSNSTQSSVGGRKKQSPKNSTKDSDDEQDVIYGPVEYPLLAMAPPIFGSDFAQKDSIVKLPNSSTLLDNVKPSGKSQKVSNKSEALAPESLTVTRAGTQRSESDSQQGEEQVAGGKKRGAKKTAGRKSAEAVEKGKKNQKKDKEQEREKAKDKQQKKDGERKKNKRQAEQKEQDSIKQEEEQGLTQDREELEGSQWKNFFKKGF